MNSVHSRPLREVLPVVISSRVTVGINICLLPMLQFSLIQPPNYHYHLNLYGGDLTLLPGVEAWLDSVINDCVIQCVATAAITFTFGGHMPHVMPQCGCMMQMPSLAPAACTPQCRSYMIPDGYVLPLVDGDLMVDLPQGILFVRLIEASLPLCPCALWQALLGTVITCPCQA